MTGSVMSSSEMLCSAPRSEPGTVTLMVSYNDQEFSIEEPSAKYIYTQGFSIASIQPSVMTTGTQHSLTVSGGPFTDTGTIMCKHGLSSGRFAAHVVTSTLIKCMALASDVPGASSVSISDNGQDFTMAAEVEAVWIRHINLLIKLLKRLDEEFSI